MIRTYSEMSQLETLEERFEYLRLDGVVGEATFGFDRHMNQAFYQSKEWRQLRHLVIARDEGCDLGVPGYEIHQGLYVHHMNPMSKHELVHGAPSLLDMDNLITVSHRTHNAIHYGDESLLPKDFKPRVPGDTNLWRTRGEKYA